MHNIIDVARIFTEKFVSIYTASFDGLFELALHFLE